MLISPSAGRASTGFIYIIRRRGEILNIYFYLYIFRHLHVRVDFHRWMDTGAKSPPPPPNCSKLGVARYSAGDA